MKDTTEMGGIELVSTPTAGMAAANPGMMVTGGRWPWAMGRRTEDFEIDPVIVPMEDGTDNSPPRCKRGSQASKSSIRSNSATVL